MPRTVAFACASLVLLPFAAIAADTSADSSATRSIRPRSDTFFGVHFDLHPSQHDTELGKDVTEAHVSHLLDRVQPDYVQYDSKGHAGLLGYPSEVGPSAPGIVNDSLAVWRKETRKRDISLYVHFSGIYDIAACAEHPEWAAVGGDGKPSPNHTSVFGPYAEKRMIPQLIELLNKYDLDGAWVDGECWAAQHDYSPAAIAAWEEETGFGDAPKKRGDPHWAEWKAFHRKHAEGHVERWVDAVHAARPGVQLASNWLYTTLTPQPVKADVDFISGDYDPSMSVDKARIEARYMASVGMPWDLMAWGFLRGHHGFGHNLKPPVHLQQEAAVVLMQGGGFQVYYQPTRSGHFHETIIDTLAQVGEFCRAREEVSHRSTSVPQVAVVFSTAAVLDRADAIGHTGAGHYPELIGALHALLESHYSVDVLPEFKLVDRIDDYPLVVLPDFDRFDPALVEAIPDYVRGGGRLLLMGPTCAKLFEPLVGVTFEGEPAGVSAHLPSEAGGLANALGGWQKVALDGATAIAQRFVDRDVREAGETAATLNAVGKGRVAAIFGPAGIYFYHQHNPWMREFIGDVARAVFPDPAVTVVGPACVEVALRRTQSGELSLHLFNRANVPTSPTYELIDYVPPAGPLTIEMAVPNKPKRVDLVPVGPASAWTWADGLLKIAIPQVGIHEVLVVR